MTEDRWVLGGPCNCRHRRFFGWFADDGGLVGFDRSANLRLRRVSWWFAEGGGLVPVFGRCILRFRRLADLSPKTEAGVFGNRLMVHLLSVE